MMGKQWACDTSTIEIFLLGWHQHHRDDGRAAELWWRLVFSSRFKPLLPCFVHVAKPIIFIWQLSSSVWCRATDVIHYCRRMDILRILFCRNNPVWQRLSFSQIKDEYRKKKKNILSFFFNPIYLFIIFVSAIHQLVTKVSVVTKTSAQPRQDQTRGQLAF